MHMKEKPKNLVGKLLQLLERREKWQTVLIMLLSVISAAAELIGVSIILPIIDLTLGQGETGDSFYCRIIMKVFGIENSDSVIIALILCTIVIYIVKDLYLIWMYGYVYRYAASVRRNFAMKLLKVYMRQPYTFFVKRKTPELIRSVNDDTNNLYEVVYSLCLLVSQAITAVCIVIYLAKTNVVMTLIVVVCLLICAGGIVKILQKTMRSLGKKNQNYQASLINYLQQSFEGIKEIKILNTEGYFTGKYDEVCTKYVGNNYKFRMANMFPKYLIETVVIIGIMSYLALCIQYSSNYAVIVPQLAVFVSAAYKLLPTVNQMYTYINTIMFYKASVDLVYRDVMEIEELEKQAEETGRAKEVEFQDRIRVENVDFAYEGAGSLVLKDVSISIPKGKSVAFIGSSGGGKTTLADLILGLQKPVKGKVLVDDKDISDYPKSWHDKIGYIPQSIFLIDDTIRNNIAFGVDRQEIDDQRIWKALEEASLKEFVESSAEGLDMIVGERGVCLSGGQRQRIGIARALYRNPEILVFDEATSALDNETEKEVMKAIDGLHGNKTMIIIAHRLSTIENCDIVYKIENQKVVQER